MTGLQRLLVAVADSPASLAAARSAVELAARLGAQLRAVHVDTDGRLAVLLGRPGPATGAGEAATVPVLAHVAELARRAGVAASTVQHQGEVGRCVLDEARGWGADLIVVGRTTRRGAGDPFIGVEAQRVLEFSDCPVLVVPGPR
ncbi:MAG TPA: universal stress protein [Blastococcus sp.]|jgi:nucleotide-binding universal stress UspA family protein|nr:universal stress protein [Blastococcus sp.]